MPMFDSPSAKLKRLMSERDVNALELSDITGLSVGTINGLRSGRINKPRTETMYMIASALHVKPHEIWKDHWVNKPIQSSQG